MNTATKIAIAAAVLVAVIALSGDADVKVIDMSPAFSPDNYSARKSVPRFIVIHYTVTGSAAATEHVLESKTFSTNFEVDRAGVIRMYLDPKLFTARASNWANPYSVAIDVTHIPGQDWPAVQMQSLAALVHALQAQFGMATGPASVAPDGIEYGGPNDVPLQVSVLRHRNVHPTKCPGDLPMELLA